MSQAYVIPYKKTPIQSQSLCLNYLEKPTTPTSFIVPVNVGENYSNPVPSYPIVKSPFQLFTYKPSYLNAIANDGDHPLRFMTFSNTQR